MILKRRFFCIAACAAMLLGISTNASATITGTGCIISGLTGQKAPTGTGINAINGLASFTSACNTANGGVATTFGITLNNPTVDSIIVNPSTAPASGTATVNQILNAAGTNITCTGPNCNTAATAGASGSAVGAISSWFLFEYVLGSNLCQLGCVLSHPAGTSTPAGLGVQHDDGISLYVNGNRLTAIGDGDPTSSANTAVTLTGTMGQTVDLVWAECCGNPGVLLVNLPGEASTVVPEPASLILLGTTILGIAGFLKRRTHV